MENYNFKFLSISSVIYAAFTTFCLYENLAGVTMLLFVIGTIYYLYLCTKKLNVSIKKSSWFHIICIILLGISTFLTGDENIIVMNYLGLFLLLISFMMHNFYEDDKWGIGKYIANILIVIVYSVGYIVKPFTDFVDYRKKGKLKEDGKVKHIIVGIVIAIPIVAIILCLLASADAVFGNLFNVIFEKITVPSDILGVIFMTALVFLLSYGFIVKLSKRDELTPNKEKIFYEPLTAITVNVILLIIYVIFSVIQIIYLFFGKLELPSGYTYAGYAREGFFQLLIVCIINLIIVIFCLYRFKSNKLLKGILTSISVCTYIMIASSAVRMLIYINAYGLTFLRIFVLWTLVVILLLISGALIYIFKQSFKLFRYTMIVVSVLYICLSFSHPDYMIASYNLNNDPINIEDNYTEIDMMYLSGLSSDAAAVINKYYEKNPKNYYIKYYFERLEDNKIGIRNFNVSKWTAKKIANEIY